MTDSQNQTMGRSKLQRKLKALPAALLYLVVVLNIAWPLTTGKTRTIVTILGVVCFFLESKIHAYISRGTRFVAIFIAVVIPIAFLAEVIGVHTGFPFGDYHYTEKLGWQLLEVPLLIPFAWFMMMYPCWVIANRMSNRRIAQIGLASWLMATWDLYLDPQMVNEGFWLWHTPAGSNTTEIPISNFIGWLLTAAVVFMVLSFVLPTAQSTDQEAADRRDQVPYYAVAWVWLGSFMANIGWFGPFFNQPKTAITGLVGMGIVLVPFYWNILRGPKVSSQLVAE